MTAIPWAELLPAVARHVLLVLGGTGLGTAIAVPLGLVLVRRRHLRRLVLGTASVLQTVPSLALFGLLIPLPWIGGIGPRSALVALTLYSLLPILRNVVVGIDEVDPIVREAARAMGMTDRQILRHVEVPLAAPVILAGIRTAAVICVGLATIAAAIGAGGLGVFIFRGLAMLDDRTILLGAVPAALLAIVVDTGLGAVERQLARSR